MCAMPQTRTPTLSRSDDLGVDTSDLVDFFWSWGDNNCHLLQAAEEPGFDGSAGSKNSNPAKLAACNFVVDGVEQANERKRSSLRQLLGADLRGKRGNGSNLRSTTCELAQEPNRVIGWLARLANVSETHDLLHIGAYPQKLFTSNTADTFAKQANCASNETKPCSREPLSRPEYLSAQGAAAG